MLSVFITILSVLLVIASVLLSLIILMQRPKQEGLGAAFGGGMMDSIAGAHTTDILQKGTVWLAVFFLTASILLAMLRTHEISRQDVGDVLEGVKKEETPLPLGPSPSISDLPPAIDLDPSGAATDPMPSPLGESPATSLLDSPMPLIDDEPKPAPEPADTSKTAEKQESPANPPEIPQEEKADKGKGKAKEKAKTGAEVPAKPEEPQKPAAVESNPGPGANN